MHAFSFQYPAYVFSTVAEAFELAYDAVEHFDLLCFFFCEIACGDIAQETCDFIFEFVGQFLQVHEFHSVFFEFVRIFFHNSFFHIVKAVSEYFSEVYDLFECL